MEKDKTYKVTLQGLGMRSARDVVACDSSLTEKEAKQYMKDLVAAFKQVPQKSCFLCMDAQFAKKETTSVSFHPSSVNKKPITKSSSKSLELHLASHLDCTNTEQKCLNNIKEGKCQDKFIIELIGKRFFPAKYQSEKQK